MWIEYKVNTVSVPDYGHVDEYTTDGTVQADCYVAGSGIHIADLYADTALTASGRIQGTGYSSYLDTNWPDRLPNPGYWYVTHDGLKAYSVVEIVNLGSDLHTGAYGGGYFVVRYTKLREIRYKQQNSIDWNTIVGVHLTEQTGQQFKRYPLVK